MPGGVSFFQATGGTTPAAQTIPIRNAGTGTLDWTATADTSDGGAWLVLSKASGTAPSTPSVSIVSANLPGKGLVAGIFNGQVLLLTGTVRATIPIQVVVGANVFEPLAALSFSKAYDGSNPGSQPLNVTSTAANFNFFGLGASANGGTWLTINPSAYGYGISTPESVEVAVDPATTLAAGSYIGEVIFTSTAGDQGMVVPVKLTVTSSTATALPTFTPPAGTYTSTQTVTIADATRGAAIYYTTDGTTPTTASKAYTTPIAVTTTGTTLEAIAIAPGYPVSAVATAVYTITQPPAATPAASQTITITEATTGATVYYTTNGTTPTAASTKYTGPITFTASTTLKFIAIAPNYNPSAVRTITVTVQ
jgi:LysM repeat protein